MQTKCRSLICSLANHINDCLYDFMTAEPTTIVDALKAAGEPTRFRILALVRQGDLAVGELVQILDQSQPRLSHHLKNLTQAGLVERLPEGSWVFYRAARTGWAARILDALFQELDMTQGAFASDIEALTTVRRSRSEAASTYFSNIAQDWDLIRNQHYPTADIESALLDAAGTGPFERVIDLGTGTGRMLSLFAPLAKDAEGLDQSHQMLTVARSNLAKTGATNASVRQGDVAATPFDTASADLVIIHQVLHYMEDPASAISEASRLLRPGGKLLIVDFAPHTLDFLRSEHGHHRLGIRDQDIHAWSTAADLALEDPIRFDPPEDLEQGLAVNLWAAVRPASQQEVAA